MVLENSPAAQKGGGPDRSIRMITEGNAEFPRDPRRIIDYPGALATTIFTQLRDSWEQPKGLTSSLKEWYKKYQTVCQHVHEACFTLSLISGTFLSCYAACEIISRIFCGKGDNMEEIGFGRVQLW